MLIELHGKAGSLCQPARAGQQQCPLMVRATSEDNVTDHIVQTLKLIAPRQWVSDFLNVALGTDRFHRQVYRGFRIAPWAEKPPYPRHLLRWDEGSTEVDCCIAWENPATTVFVEAKYGSGLSLTTSNNRGQFGYPADQLRRPPGRSGRCRSGASGPGRPSSTRSGPGSWPA